MRRTWLAGAAMALLIGQAGLPAHAAPLDRTLNVQGMVATSGGVPANGTFTMDFKLYVAETGGTALWSQSIANVSVVGGVFDVELGPVSTGPLESNSVLWLETVVDGTALPRRPLRAVGYALVAQVANDLQCSGCVGGATIADGGVGPAKLASGTYGINISGNAATATSATSALTAKTFTDPLAGDVSGTQGATKVTRVWGVPVSATAPTGGQVLQYDAAGSQWKAATPSGGSVTSVNTGAGLTGGPITTTGTLSIANNGVKPAMVSSGTYGISISGNAATATSAASFSGALGGDVQGTQAATTVAKIRGVAVSTTAPASGQVLKFNGTSSAWEPAADSAGTGTVKSVATGKGLQGGTITSTGTLSVRLNGSGGLSDSLGGGSNELGIKPGGVTPAMVSSGTYGVNISGSAASANTANSATSFSGALGGDVTGGQTATVVGKIRGVAVAGTTPTGGQVLKYDAATSQWAPSADNAGTGTVKSVATGAGLTGGTITSTGTISIKNGGITPAMVSSGTYGVSISGNAATATTASSFSGGLGGDVQGTQAATTVAKLRGVALSTTTPANGQVLKYNSGTSQWEPGTDSAGSGTVKSVATGKGLQGGTITSAGTLSVRVNSAGGLSDSLGGGSNELGIKPGGVTPAMMAGGTYGINISGSAASASTATTATNFSGALGGDVTGGQAATTVGKIRGVTVATTSPANGQVLKYSSSTGQWTPSTDATGSGVTSVTASSPLASSGGTAPNITLGTVPITKGGTGITSGPSAAGQFLRSTGGGTWGIAGIQAGDLPGGNGNYIWNTTSTQSANFTISGNGTAAILYGNASVRAPIFYDLNNTGYYIDPASNSQVSSIYANGWFRAQGQSGFYFQDYGGGWYMTDATWIRAYNNKALWVNNEIQSTSNVRAPIFYDLNDGAYYTDPNGTSRMNVIHPNVVSCMNGTCPANNVVRLTPNLHLNAGQGYAVIINWDNGAVGAGTQMLRIGNGSSGDVFYVRADGLSYGVQYRDINDGNYYVDPNGVSIMSDVRATIFYDLNDTGYRVDPNGTSQLHYVLANNWFRPQGQTGLYFESYGGGWHMTDTTWIRAYNGKGVYADAEIRSGSNVRAPILYDLNDGSFYTDPNGTSRMQHARFDGRLWYEGGCPAPFTSLTSTHSFAGYSNRICVWKSGHNNFSEMQNVCFAMGGHICTYSDIYAVSRSYGTSPAGIGILNGWWIGMYYSDDVAYCVNIQGDRNNFEGSCHKHNDRYAACCYVSSHNE